MKRTELKFLCRIKTNAYKCQHPVKREQAKTKMVGIYGFFAVLFESHTGDSAEKKPPS